MREKTEEANADEAPGEHVQEESPEEFIRADRHGPRHAPACVIRPSMRWLLTARGTIRHACALLDRRIDLFRRQQHNGLGPNRPARIDGE